MRQLVLLFAFVGGTLQAQVIRVLFIGNSYTTQNDLPAMFQALALSLGDTVEVAFSAPGGFTLQDHWKYAPTLDAIDSQPWDVVVFQEQSQIPSFPDGNNALATSIGLATLLSARIKQNRECTLPVFYMTWGRENGDESNCDMWPPVCTYEGMQALIRERYLYMALLGRASVAPVGMAWKHVRDTHPLIDLYESDGSHPTVTGTYLAACTFYSTLFHASCVGASFTSSVQPDTAAVLQQIASAIVADSAATWRLDQSPGLTADVFWIEGFPGSSFFNYGFHHAGQGQHLWTCSNGETSTSADAYFTVHAQGTYDFTHHYTDLCGIADLYEWQGMAWFESGMGLEPDMDATELAYDVTSISHGTVDVNGASGGEQLTIADLQGRVLVQHRLAGGCLRLACPAGLQVWRIVQRDGRSAQGKVLVQ